MKVQGSIIISMVSNGDTITSQLESTEMLGQFIKAGTNQFMPDWRIAENQPVIKPVAFSQNSKTAVPVVNGSEKWLYNGVELTFDAEGLSTNPKGLFQKVVLTEQGVKIPALRIVNNLVSTSNTDNDRLTFEGKAVVGQSEFDIMPSRDITLQKTMGDPYDGFISASDSGVLTNEVASTTCKAYLRRGGAELTTGVTYKWFKRGLTAYEAIASDVNKPDQKTFKRDDVDANLIIKVEYYINSEMVYSVTRSISDLTDPLALQREILSGSEPLVGEASQITYGFKIIRKNTQTEIPTKDNYSFSLQKITGQEVREGTGKQFAITGKDFLNAKVPQLRLVTSIEVEV